MPKKPTLSPSKITTYLACPVKYRWTYVDDRGKWYLRSKSYYSFGTTLHRVLERFYDSNDAGVTTTEEAVAAMEESWIDAGYSSSEEMMEAYGEGKAILERHVEEFKRKPTEAKTLYIEKLFTFDYPKFQLLGRVDRVDEHEDGSLEIVDYKSGRDVVTEEDVSTDIAMSVYQLLLKREHPDRRVFASICALRTGCVASFGLPEEEYEALERDLEQLGMHILSWDKGDFYDVTPVYKPICPRCDFIPLCRKHPDFAEI